MVAMCSLSNSKIRLFSILKRVIILFAKVNHFILLTKYLVCLVFLFIFFIRADNI